jgi:hypothetical protein
VHGRYGNPAGDHAVRESGDHVWLKCESRNTAADGGKHGGAGGVSSDADDYVGAKIGEHASRDPKGAGQVEHRLGAGHQADVFQGADFDEFEWVSGLGDEARLNAAGGADRHVEFHVGDAERDASKALLVRLIAAYAVATWAGGFDIIVVLAELKACAR